MDRIPWPGPAWLLLGTSWWGSIACAGEPTIDGSSSEASNPDDAGSVDTITSEDGATPGPTCDVPHYPDQSEPMSLERLEARVVDSDGQPVPGVMTQACGVNLCLILEDTDSSGRVSHQGSDELQRAAFKYGDGIRYAQLALLLGQGPEHALGDQVTVPFPELGSGSPFVPGETLHSEGVRLVLGADTSVEPSELDFSKDEQVFLAREFPAGRFPEAAANEDFAMLVALGPVKTKLCPPAKLILPNTQSLLAGRELSLFVHSTDIRAEFAAYGEWAEVSGAHVSEDGETIETDAGEGLPFLGVIGIK